MPRGTESRPTVQNGDHAIQDLTVLATGGAGKRPARADMISTDKIDNDDLRLPAIRLFAPGMTDALKSATELVRIAVVTHYFSTHRGGVEKVAGELAVRLAKTGRYSLTWVASDASPVPAPATALQFESVRAYNILEQRGFPWPVWPMQSIKRLRFAIAGADIVHLHDFIYFGNLAAFVIARNCGKPIVITQHIGDIPYKNRLLRFAIWLINRTIGRIVLGNADRVAFISEAVRKQFSGFVEFRRPPVHLPNGVDTGIFFPVDALARKAIRSGLGIDRGQKVVLYVGRFVDKKGLPVLRKLAAAMPDVHWWFAGWGSLESAAHPATWRLTNVRLFSGRSGSTLAELYRAADLLLLPSMSEGFPLVVQEAMACGTRALVTTAIADGAPEAGKLLLTCPIDPPETTQSAWRSAISSALCSDDEELRARLVEFARAHWAWDHAVASYCELFDDLLKKDSAPA